MKTDSLIKNASLMVVKGKGILAADESTPTCTKRFEALGIESTFSSRNAYRNLLFTTSVFCTPFTSTFDMKHCFLVSICTSFYINTLNPF